MADTERKRAMVDDYEPTQLLMIARVLGYVGTAILCLDLIGLMIIGIVLAMGIGG
ncbi:MAG: mannose/fructose/N-acetylgalactosamine-specific phosphotransferase system component IIC [Myxococcota bacterium]|jgi:mannose/fructose/N-acetylgalactosamine-specific phosphotransferase system component IIC